MQAMKSLPITPAPLPENEPLSQTAMGDRIRENLCGVYLTVRRPSGRPMMQEVKIEATSTANDQQAVKKEDVTNPCWKIDIHPLWGEIDGNSTQIDKCMIKYSVSASIKGEHLVSLLRAGKMLNELNSLRKRRLELADKLASVWFTEVIPGLEQKFPQFFENQIRKRLPDPISLRDRFDVYWIIRPLTPLDNSHLRLDELTEDEAREVIGRNQEFVDKIVQQQLGTIFNEAFAEVAKLCDDINSGEYAFGRRKENSIIDILNALEKVKNFGDFANPDVLAKVDIAAGTIKQFKLTQINKNTRVQDTIKQAMRPLGEALKQLSINQVGTGRVSRIVEL